MKIGISLAATTLASFTLTSFAAHADGPPPMSLLKRPHVGEPLMSRAGDESELPARRPDGLWLPLEVLPGLRLATTIKIQGHDLKVWLDTGAQATTITKKAAHDLGLDAPNVVRNPIGVRGAAGGSVDAYYVDVPDIEFGSHMKGAHVVVVPEVEESVDGLLGFEILSQVDLMLAVDEGQLGVFPASKGFIGARDNIVMIQPAEAVLVPAHFAEHDIGRSVFILDTGAWHSLLDSGVGDGAGLKVDKRFPALIGGVDGAAKSDGVYVIDHLYLGKERVDVGALRPYRTTGGNANPDLPQSLLGADVTMRQRTLLSTQRGQLRMAPMPIRPATRSHGPDGKPCVDAAGKERPCVEVAVGQKDGKPCVGFAIDKAWGGKHISALIDVLDKDGNNALAGGFFYVKADVPAEGFADCVDPQHVLPAYGIATGAPISLLRFRVVDKAPDECPPAEPAEHAKDAKDAAKDTAKDAKPAGDAKLAAPSRCVVFTGASPE
jgi:hypothetical protein